ncbi:hypothetical protein L209DRAFT_90322 [Thermothelomyces heterothallicus CBS 203.75]
MMSCLVGPNIRDMDIDGHGKLLRLLLSVWPLGYRYHLLVWLSYFSCCYCSWFCLGSTSPVLAPFARLLLHGADGVGLVGHVLALLLVF